MQIIKPTDKGEGLRTYARKSDRQRAETQLRNEGFTEFVRVDFDLDRKGNSFGLYFTGFAKPLDYGNQEPDFQLIL